MGLYDDLYPPVAERSVLVDGTRGAEIFFELAPAPGEHVIKKHRYSAFFATDLDLILREWGIDTVVVSGTTTENCCHATARDAMFHNYRVIFLSDLTGTFDYPDLGYGALPAEEVHRATLIVLAFSTAHVMTGAELIGAWRRTALPPTDRGSGSREWRGGRICGFRRMRPAGPDQSSIGRLEAPEAAADRPFL